MRRIIYRGRTASGGQAGESTHGSQAAAGYGSAARRPGPGRLPAVVSVPAAGPVTVESLQMTACRWQADTHLHILLPEIAHKHRHVGAEGVQGRLAAAMRGQGRGGSGRSGRIGHIQVAHGGGSHAWVHMDVAPNRCGIQAADSLVCVPLAVHVAHHRQSDFASRRRASRQWHRAGGLCGGGRRERRLLGPPNWGRSQLGHGDLGSLWLLQQPLGWRTAAMRQQGLWCPTSRRVRSVLLLRLPCILT